MAYQCIVNNYNPNDLRRIAEELLDIADQIEIAQKRNIPVTIEGGITLGVNNMLPRTFTLSVGDAEWRAIFPTLGYQEIFNQENKA